jgi:DNA-binding XRE family transcriptional regulator
MLGVNQGTVSRIESGGLYYCNPLLKLSRLIAVLGERGINHVLFGTDAERFRRDLIQSRYWKEKNATKGPHTTPSINPEHKE